MKNKTSFAGAVSAFIATKMDEKNKIPEILIRDMVDHFLFNKISIQTLEFWQSEDYQASMYRPITMGQYWILKPLSPAHIDACIAYMKKYH